MNDTPSLRLLAQSDNERGDLFTRLAQDLFFALGYDDLRLNVHKSGRELDIQGKHRLEPRLVVGECKAHVAKIGGDVLNKFFGALTRERKKAGSTPVAGYFVSVSGFTETGIEQENETGDDQVILLHAARVISELERSRVIVDRAHATERAGQCAQHAGLQDAALDGIELLGHQRGYIWAVFYSQGKERTHFALIHADGTALSKAVADEVIQAEKICGGTFQSLKYLAPAGPAQDRLALISRVGTHYRQWLAEDCGYIQLDGLPADTDLSATRLKLERLFVPIRATYIPREDDHPDLRQTYRDMSLSIGELLEGIPHLALLAMPGGGKSTLLKRLATAYAFPERRKEIADDLPERDWLPLILRCRELRDRAHRPILELLDDIPRYAGLNLEECAAFRDLIHGSLRSGVALLLVDGLDEISDEGARRTFTNHLRTFIAMFPQAALVLTSREAGFRLVASVVAGACESATLAPLDEEDVLSLCERWHVEVVGDTPKVRAEARELGQTIWNNSRIRTLTENPLLLTTLLVVKRCIGELPHSRTTLYREAIRVLVRTWNVEGYAPMDEDETLAQLSYVACAMMVEGKQQIGQKALLKLLQNARRELEPELQFARISPQDFIERIEYRSSLLMQVGLEKINDELQPIFEFRHLTFQEYLAARGYVEEQYPGRDAGQTLVEALEQHFEDERWREVIPLAAVLAGRKAEDLVKRITATCEEAARSESWTSGEQTILENLLLHCIRDEVQVTQPTLRGAFRTLADDRWHHMFDTYDSDWIIGILKSKFGEIFQDVVKQTYMGGGPSIDRFAPTLKEISLHQLFNENVREMSSVVAQALRESLENDDRLKNIQAALVSMWLAFQRGSEQEEKPDRDLLRESFHCLSDGLSKMLSLDDLPRAFAASWALAWIGEQRLLLSPPKPEMLLDLYLLWRDAEFSEQKRFFAWAFSAQELLPRDTFPNNVWGDCDDIIRRCFELESQQFQHFALVVSWYRRAPWTDRELVGLISEHLEGHEELLPSIREMLESLGELGLGVLNEWQQSATGQVPRRKTKARRRNRPDSSAQLPLAEI